MSEADSIPALSSFRRDFLESLFRKLNSAGIRFCVLRNYLNLYDDNTSDVDMMVEPKALQTVDKALLETLRETGGKLIRRADFVCRTYIFYGRGQLFHIDLEYCKRWRIFSILRVEEVLDQARPYGEFFVPTPEHEAVVLWAQSLCAATLTERYRKNLVRLFKESKPGLLAETYRNSFGDAGAWLLKVNEELVQEADGGGPCRAEFDLRFFWKLRKALVHTAACDLGRALLNARFASWDARRLVSRFSSIAGMRCTVVSTVSCPFDCERLLRELAVLFPPSKTKIRLLNNEPSSFRARFFTAWEDFKRLFRGGILIRHQIAASDAEVSAAGTRIGLSRRWFKHAEALALHYSSQKTFAVNAVSGFGETVEGKDEIVRFFVEASGQNAASRCEPVRRGLFCVLLGLDGSGKTSAARAIFEEAPKTGAFSGIRYLHWVPKPWSRPLLPVPSFGNIPRLPPQKRNALNAIFSSCRLLKNLLFAQAAYFLYLRRWLSRGTLVLVDRYYYNYQLDPDSVRYAGPQWLLRTLLPLFPKPDLVLVLWADTATLLQRKQELSPEQIAVQRELLEKLARKGPAVKIDAAQSLPAVAQDAMAAILRAHAGRK